MKIFRWLLARHIPAAVRTPALLEAVLKRERATTTRPPQQRAGSICHAPER